MKRLLIIGSLIFLMACNLSSIAPGADDKFGRQNFNSAVALIELHKTRNGQYPESLEDLEHLGDWDQIWITAVRYERTATGYNLFVERGWVGEPDLTYPPSFKQGLGLESSNVKWEAN